MTDKIYYADKEILGKIDREFDLFDGKSWYELYQHKADNTFWRLDKWDKYQERFFVRLDSKDSWTEFDDKELRIELLRKTRGTIDKKCIWKNCGEHSLTGLVYCERHAYEEMGIRR